MAQRAVRGVPQLDCHCPDIAASLTVGAVDEGSAAHLREFREIAADDVIRSAIPGDTTILQPDYALAKVIDHRHVMAHEQYRATFLVGDFAHLAEAFFLKCRITDGEDLVHEEDLSFKVCRHGEGQADVHATGVPLHGCIDELVYLREIDDLLKLAVNFSLRHAEDRAA